MTNEKGKVVSISQLQVVRKEIYKKQLAKIEKLLESGQKDAAYTLAVNLHAKLTKNKNDRKAALDDNATVLDYKKEKSNVLFKRDIALIESIFASNKPPANADQIIWQIITKYRDDKERYNLLIQRFGTRTYKVFS